MTKILKPICLMIVLALVLSFSLVIGAPAAAQSTTITFNVESDSPLSYTEADMEFKSLYPPIGDGHIHLEDGGLSIHSSCCSTPYQIKRVDGQPFTLVQMDVVSVSGGPITFTPYVGTTAGTPVTVSSTGTFVFPTRFAGVTRVLWDDAGDEDSMLIDNLVVTLGEEPGAAFNASPTMGEAPLHVQFRDTSTGDYDERAWNFGDGGSSTGVNPSHIYQDEGNYTVSLTVSGPNGESSASKDIMVESMAVAARLSVRNLNISATHAQPRQAVMITANVMNEGGTWGSQTLNLLINGYLEQSVGVGVAPGTSQPINFTVYKVQAGEYQVTIGDATGTFFVLGEAAPPKPPQPGLLVGGELDQGGIIAIIVIGIILVGGIVVAVLFTRRT